ncbi:MAG: hypothetical protein HYZ88_03430 [Candidatus Omnitrophica bacterium]|nr:hypothetical protein [Candidatus Omnitrophota bacterium]
MKRWWPLACFFFLDAFDLVNRYFLPAFHVSRELRMPHTVTLSVPGFGLRPPSTHREQIDKEICLHADVIFENGNARLQSSLANQSGTFTQISVKKNDLALVIKRIKKEARHGQHPHVQEAH